MLQKPVAFGTPGWASGMLGHLAAKVCTVSAGGGAVAAVLHIGVAFTFLRTCVADLFAKVADLFRKVAVQAHDLRGGSANSGAFQVQLNAAGHRFYIFFEQAGAGALLAGRRTGSAGFDTFLIV